jgi:maleylpyruvate isomerase
MMKLFTYYRSSASYRVRIALNLKGLTVEHIPVNLLKLEQRARDYEMHNPQQLVPTLVTQDGVSLTQSLAIMEYLDERYPDAPLLPRSPQERARVRALALAIACEISPLNNLRVLNYLGQEMGADDQRRQTWYQHWVASGFNAVETMLRQPHTGTFSHGDRPTMADCCLVPQVYNAVRFECDMTPYPCINRIIEACEALPAFRDAHPTRQPDAPNGQATGS